MKFGDGVAMWSKDRIKRQRTRGDRLLRTVVAKMGKMGDEERLMEMDETGGCQCTVINDSCRGFHSCHGSNSKFLNTVFSNL